MRLTTPLLSHYQPSITQWLSRELHAPISLGQIEASWHGLAPSIKIEDLVILDKQSKQPVFSINKVYIGLSISKSILHRQLVLGHLLVDGAELSVQHKDGRWYLTGVSNEATTDDKMTVTLQQVANWFSVQRRLELLNVDINLILPDKKSIMLHHLNAIFLQKEHQKYRIRGRFQVGNKKSSQLKFALNASGEVDRLKKIRTRFYLDAKKIDLKPWLSLFNRWGLKLQSGRLEEIKLQGRYKNQRIAQLQSQFDFQDISIFGHQVPMVNNFAGKAAIKTIKNGDWDMVVDMEKLKVNQQTWPKNWFSIRKSANLQQSYQEYSCYLHYAELSPLFSLFKAIKSRESYPFVDKINAINGEVKNFYLVFPGRFSEHKNFSLSADFNRISWKIADYPQLNNISGHVIANAERGEIAVDSLNSTFDYPRYFGHSLILRQLSTNVLWHKNQDGLQISVPNLEAEDDISQLKSHFSLKFPLQGKPNIEVLAHLQAGSFNAVDVMQRLPTKIMSPKVLGWLEQANLQGKSLASTLIIKGHLEDFPYLNVSGTFNVLSQFEDLKLSYLPSWPVAEHLDGYLRFHKDSMEALVNSGKLMGADLSKTKIHIPHLVAAPARLYISGNAKGDMQDGLNYIERSPLKFNLGHMIQPITPKGPLDLNLKIDIPLKPNLSTSDVHLNGTIDLKENSIQLNKLPNIILTNLFGKIIFDCTSIGTNRVVGKLWGNHLTANVKTFPEQLYIQLISGFSASKINQLLGLKSSRWFSGKTDLKAELRINKNTKNTFELNTNLDGLKIDLPKPFTKGSRELWPSRFEMLFDEKNVDMTLLVGEEIKGKLSMPLNASAQLAQGYLLFGQKEAPSEREGIWFVGKLKQWVWHQWQELLTSVDWKGFGTSKCLDDILYGIDFSISDLQLFGLNLPDTRLTAKYKEENWQFYLNGKNINGQVNLPTKFGYAIDANFDYLNIQPMNISTVNTELSPESIPSLQLSIKDTWYNELPLGKLNLKMTRDGEGLVINNFEFAMPWLHFSSHGAWYRKDQQLMTEFSGELKSNNLSRTLSQWALPRHLHGSKAKFIFNLQWPGSPLDIDFKKVSGIVKARVKNGYFSGLGKDTDAKIGLGNLVNILSIHSISKRLQLNFRDFTQKGYHFDILKGHFKLDNGVTYTPKLRFLGSVADITVKGLIGLLNETYDLNVTVVPHLTASLPVLATLAGGPMAGAVTWLLDKAVGNEVNHMTRYEYLVTGTWQKPLIEPSRSPMRPMTKHKTRVQRKQY